MKYDNAEFDFVEWLRVRCKENAAPAKVWENLPYAFREHDGFTDEPTDVVALLYKDWKATGLVKLSVYGVDESIWGVVDTSVDVESMDEVSDLSNDLARLVRDAMPRWFEEQYAPSLA